MVLTPEHIERQVFRERRFGGYDPEDVDRFLDRVAERMQHLGRERDELAARLRTMEAQASEALESEQLLKRTLLAAQRTADETVAEARVEAERILAEAERRAEERIASADQYADERLSAAKREADDLLRAARYQAAREQAEAHAAAEQVRRSVEDLRRLRAEYRERVRGVIAEHLALLDRAGDVPDLPPALDDLSVLQQAAPRDPAVASREAHL